MNDEVYVNVYEKDDNVHCVLLSLSVKRIQPRMIKASGESFQRISLCHFLYPSFWFCHKMRNSDLSCHHSSAQFTGSTRISGRGAFKGGSVAYVGMVYTFFHFFLLCP